MTPKPAFPKTAPRADFPKLDSRILAFWDSIDAFQTSVQLRADAPEYTFYDGPPFATGSPHYGHILQGVVKDIVPRYWTMRGYKVERRFGWDTHGLPVEMEVEKQLGVSGPREIQNIGVAAFNEACRAMVNTTTEDWYDITSRIGRWVDFEDDYKTMDVDFMESVWWVFGQLWEKGLIYQDFKVLPYSYGAATPLSNFEANLDYRDVDDPAITVSLEVLEGHGPAESGDKLLIWTTTPWTLPGNLAVAVGKANEYARVTHPDKAGAFWLAADRVEAVFGEGATVTSRNKGSDLLGISYVPPFDHFAHERANGAFVVISSPEVSVSEGTGLVHMAPAYGETDFVALSEAKIEAIVDPVDAQAKFTSDVPEVEGVNVKEADAALIALLKDSGKLFARSTINHSYPFCWRTGTPLIYKAIPTWFVAVEKFKDRMVEVNEDIRWVPEAIGTKRFGNWLEGARDWAISRNRYWGSCIPIWQCENCSETVCMSSREELRELSGVMVDDLHKQFVDEVKWQCASCQGTMTRVPEVLDCWFESGSMPFAQIHYPFENKERFEERFPADFIAEGLDQTRGWFYTLLVLSTAIRDSAPFQNCVVTGMILAEDGRKMSKSLKNYPDPSLVIDEFGADALRAYLINSPVVRGEPLRFAEDGVKDVVRTVLLPLWNAYSFFNTYAEADHITPDDLASAPPLAERPEIDRWIISVLQSLIGSVNREMETYRLFSVVPPIIGFVSHLTNWYIRRSRRRFWAQRDSGDSGDKLAAFATLHEVLTTFATVAAPVLPFITEEMYQGLVLPMNADAPRSVHHMDYPVADESAIDLELERSMETVRSIVNLGRGLRKREEIRVRQPLSTVTIVTRTPHEREAVGAHATLIAEELNVRSVKVHADEAGLIDLSAKANFKILGPKYGKEMKAVALAIASVDHATIERLMDGESVTTHGYEISAGDILVERTPRAGTVVASEGSLSVALDCAIDQELRIEGIARELVNRIQGLRRDLGLNVTDHITVEYSTQDAAVVAAFDKHAHLIAGEVLGDEVSQIDHIDSPAVDLGGESVRLSIALR
ncbi:MAG: isoleucine--tRNA ligase [Actinomycetota bacterium]|nr:isoleucine--tRNA ligase [Actinomycetota bacterium]